MRRIFRAAAVALLCGMAAASASAQDDTRIVFPSQVQQGSMVIGKVPPGSVVEYGGRTLRTTGYGSVVFGVGRNEKGPAVISITRPDGQRESATVTVTARDWPEQRISGVPPATVNPPPALAERIRREQARVTEARVRDDARADFTQPFIR